MDADSNISWVGYVHVTNPAEHTMGGSKEQGSSLLPPSECHLRNLSYVKTTFVVEQNRGDVKWKLSCRAMADILRIT